MTRPMIFDVWAFMMKGDNNRIGFHFVTKKARRYIVKRNSAARNVLDQILWLDYDSGLTLLQEYQADGLYVAFDGERYDN